MGYNWQQIEMGKKCMIIMCFLGLLTIGNTISAQTRTKVSEGLYLVDYAGTYVIEDEINQRSVSLTITEEIRDRNSDERTYKVVCGKWSKRVVKDGLRAAIAGGIAASGATGGTSAIVSAAATLALYIYDDYCEDLERKRR